MPMNSPRVQVQVRKAEVFEAWTEPERKPNLFQMALVNFIVVTVKIEH